MDIERRISAKELQTLVNDHTTNGDETIPVKRLRKQICGEQLRKAIDNARTDDEEIPDRADRADDKRSFSAKELQHLIEKRAKERKAELVESFIGAFTLHGYPEFHEASGIRKLLWGIVLATMAILIIRLTYLSYSPENLYKQIIQLETKKVNKIYFPTVTICNYSPVRHVDAHKRFPVNITEEEFELFYYQVLSNRRDFGFGNQELVNRVLRELKGKGYSSYTDILQLFEKVKEEDISSSIVRTIMRRNRCLYENEPCNFKKHFKTVYRHTSQSLCLQFNYYEKDKEGLSCTGNDIENGFFMSWDISGLHYYYDYGLHGLLVEIHPYGTPHHLIDHRNTIYLEPGSLTDIDIVEVETHRLPPPFKPNCGEHELEIIKNYPYSQAVCGVDCYLEKIMEECGCVVDQFAEYVGDERICNVTEMPCVFEASQEIHCHGCPLKCISRSYQTDSSRLSFGNTAIFPKDLRSTPGWENKSRADLLLYSNLNIVSFRIGFKSLEKQLRNYVETMPWFERISLLGGTISLLLGLSLTTCFEFLSFVVDYMMITIKYRCTRKYLADLLNKGKL